MSGLPIRNIRRGNAMKIMSLALLLMASMAFVLVGCSDKSAPLVAPTDQSAQTPAPLAKAVIHYFSGKEINPTYWTAPLV
jgi:PBP1b-binding outer membrane lipoprotein LpoB